MFTANVHRSAVPGGWIVRSAGTMAFVPDPGHAWRIEGALDTGEATLTGDTGALRRLPVPQGWLLLNPLRFVCDPDHGWLGRWERWAPPRRTTGAPSPAGGSSPTSPP